MASQPILGADGSGEGTQGNLEAALHALHRHVQQSAFLRTAVGGVSEAVVGVMDDLIDGVGGDSGPGLRFAMGLERALDLLQPGIQRFGGACI